MRRGTRRGESGRPPTGRVDRRIAARIGGGIFVIEWVCRSESNHVQA
jgi:hypothetical protein